MPRLLTNDQRILGQFLVEALLHGAVHVEVQRMGRYGERRGEQHTGLPHAGVLAMCVGVGEVEGEE